MQQDVGVLQHHGLALPVGDEIGGDEAAVELHALHHLQVGFHGLGFLDRDHPVLANLLHGVGDELADGQVALGRNGGDGLHLFLLSDLLGAGLDVGHGDVHGLGDAPLDAHGVDLGGHCLHSLVDDGEGQHGGRGRAVAGHVVGLLGHFLDQLGAHVLERLLEIDLLGDGHPVVGDRRSAELLAQHDVPALGTQRDPHRIGHLLRAVHQRLASVLLEQQLLCHRFHSSLSCLGPLCGGAGRTLAAPRPAAQRTDVQEYPE